MLSRYKLVSFFIVFFSVFSLNSYATHGGADITINVSGYLENQPNSPVFDGTIGAICYNYTTGEQVSNSDIPILHFEPITISCVHDLGLSEPTPGDSVRIVVVGDPEYRPYWQKIAAFVTGLDSVSSSDCRNNTTLDKKIITGTASDVANCSGLDIGFVEEGFFYVGAPSNAQGRVALGEMEKNNYPI